MAPNNTTQFLLEDREARVEAEKDEVGFFWKIYF